MDRFGVRLAYKIFSPHVLPEAHKFDSVECANKVYRKHPPVILLHGITNTKETWDICGQAIANRTDTKVYSLDARNHGESDWTDKIDYINMAEDVTRFMDAMDITTAIVIGHSMGGKTAMCFALRHPRRIHSMIIEDMSLNNPQSADDFVRRYLVTLREVLREIPPDANIVEAKKITAGYLSPQEQEGDQTNTSTRSDVWEGRDLPLTLKPGGGYAWKTNLEAIQASISRGEFTPGNLLEGTNISHSEALYDGPVLLIYGTHSPLDVLKDKENFLKQFPKTVYEAVEGGTHSIHTEHAETFTELVCNFILKHRHLKSRF